MLDEDHQSERGTADRLAAHAHLPRGRLLVDVDEAQRKPHNIIERAFVTFLFGSTAYVAGVEALVQSFMEAGITIPLVVTTPHPVPAALSEALQRVVECADGRVQIVHVPAVKNPCAPPPTL